MRRAVQGAGPPTVVFDAGMPGIGRQQAGGCPAVSSCGASALRAQRTELPIRGRGAVRPGRFRQTAGPAGSARHLQRAASAKNPTVRQASVDR